MADLKKVEYYADVLYKISFDFTIYGLNGLPDNHYQKDEQFLLTRDQDNRLVFMSLVDKSLLSLSVVRKLNKSHKKPVMIFFKDELEGVRV